MDNTPLDAPIPPLKKSNPVQKVLLTIEVVLWTIVGLAILLKAGSWSGGSEILIITLTTLPMLYLIAPIFLFGSKGWLRGVGSHIVGIILPISFIAWLFKLESWPYATEMGIVSGFLCLGCIAGVLILVSLKRSRWTDDNFYKHILVRLVIAALLSSGPFFSIFYR